MIQNNRVGSRNGPLCAQLLLPQPFMLEKAHHLGCDAFQCFQDDVEQALECVCFDGHEEGKCLCKLKG